MRRPWSHEQQLIVSYQSSTPTRAQKTPAEAVTVTVSGSWIILPAILSQRTSKQTRSLLGKRIE